MRTFCTIVVLGLITVISMFLVLVNFWLALAMFVVLIATFAYNAVQTVPANPPHKAILMILGKRQNVVLDEGWNFVPLYPVIFNFILVKVEKVNYDLEPQQVRTPDRAVISISASITWIPGIENSPESYIDYLNSGGEDGVRSIIHDVIEDRIKTWAYSNTGGPSIWMEAQTLEDDTHEALVRDLLGDMLASVDSLIPANTWMRFFDKPQSEPTEYDANPRNGWAWKGEDSEGKPDWNWDGLQKIYDSYPNSEQLKLKEQVDQRKKDIRKIRSGKGDFRYRSLGITIVRFTVNEVKVMGRVAKAAEMEEKKRRERDADKIRIDNISERAKKLMVDHPDLTLKQAFELVQVERGKVTKTIIDVTGSKTVGGQ